ncbi:hypothetical protein [Glutamicibacter sp.]|uniref:hypothetical protein n=1 Tax=Glutamicibacter sp. TaxID=1931995 RepID=UPI003D6BCF00
MRDFFAGRDIVGCTFTEIAGNDYSNEILEQGAEELAKAEFDSRQIVRDQRIQRMSRAVLFGALALLFAVITVVLGYFWLFEKGEVSISDIVEDFSRGISGALIAALVTPFVSLLVAVISGSKAYDQKDPTTAEALNLSRMDQISTRWMELKSLGLPAKLIKELRRKAKSKKRPE